MHAAIALCLLAAPQGSSWNRVVGALQLIAEEHHETLELPDPEARRTRQEQLAQRLGEVVSLVPWPGLRAEVEALRGRLVGTDYEVGPTARALIRKIFADAPIRRTPSAQPRIFWSSGWSSKRADTVGRAPR